LVKLEFTIETPVLPKIDRDEIREVANATAMTLDPNAPSTPFRKDLMEEETYTVLANRNILRQFVPAPTNVVMIDNQDWKTVAVRVAFFWEGEIKQEYVKTVASRSNLSVQGKGDVSQIEGTYADGKSFGPQRFDFTRGKDWSYVVAEHHAPPPPSMVDLAVNNQHGETVFLEVVVMTEDNKLSVEPVMVFEPGQSDVRVYKDLKSADVTARYASGVRAPMVSFKPAAGKQTYVVPPEPAAPEAQVERPVEDSPADPSLTVTGLLTYEGVHELIATGGRGVRRVIRAGEENTVDGGTLLAVHPLGGIVRMPTGNYYIYPLGRSFTERVLLSAHDESELAEAIDEWSRQ
jgi:hypothetical protein